MLHKSWCWLGLVLGFSLCLLYPCAAAAQGFWVELADTPGPVDTGGALAAGAGGALYALQGATSEPPGGNSGFWRYDPAQGMWVTLAEHPVRASSGGALAWAGGDFIYAFSGGSTAFWRYSMSGNEWSARADTPGRVIVGGSLAWTINNALQPVIRPDPCQAGAFAGQNVALKKPVTASRFGPSNNPQMAVDGIFDTWWGAEDFAPQWIEIDLQAAYNVAGIRLVTSQWPVGATVHRVWGRGATGEECLLHEFSGTTHGEQVLEHWPAAAWAGIRYVRVETVSSPSWVSWHEIEVISTGS